MTEHDTLGLTGAPPPSTDPPIRLQVPRRMLVQPLGERCCHA
ncbi:MAG: hypothetical protein ABI746_06930 [Dermatophilaceae bacterium]